MHQSTNQGPESADFQHSWPGPETGQLVSFMSVTETVRCTSYEDFYRQ